MGTASLHPVNIGYNTMVGAGDITRIISPESLSADIVQTVTVHDNYFDAVRGCGSCPGGFGPNDSSPKTIFVNNVNMVTNAIVQDANATAVPIIASFSTDSGIVGDGITNDNTLTLTGTAVANSTVKVFDGATQIGTATTNSSGAWSYTTGTLTNSTHRFTVTATDASGNTGGLHRIGGDGGYGGASSAGNR